MSKYFCLCADDFGFNEPINQAILQLAQHRRLQAVSCMTQSPLWQSASQSLLYYHHHLDIGLHLNFTHGFGGNYHLSLKNLMLKAWSRLISSKLIYASIQLQWQSFVDEIGCEPDFVDGHQHVHQFPIVRETLLKFLQEQKFKGWVRNLLPTLATPNHNLKTWLLPQLGARQLQHDCQSIGISQNKNFAGVYDFNPLDDYSLYMRAWMQQASPNSQTLLMCHPGLKNDTNQDVISKARLNEFKYLNSIHFIEDCEKFDIKLGCLSDFGV